MNIIEALPFLDGWDHLVVREARTVQKGQYVNVFSRPVKGWMVSLDFITDDAFASVRIIHLGHLALLNSHSLYLLGAYEPVAFGSFSTLYLRPSVLSTAGLYSSELLSPTNLLPLRGLVRVSFGLEIDSTQVTANTTIIVIAIEVTNERAFIKSVRRFMYGWVGAAFNFFSHLPGLHDIALPDEIKEILDQKEKK